MNLLKETEEILRKHGKQIEDVWYAALFFDLYDDMFTVNLGGAHSAKDFEVFKNALDTDYDNGFGGQEVFGFIVLNDTNWIERHEYDGSEWWEYKEMPNMTRKTGLEVKKLSEQEEFMKWDIIEMLQNY